VVSGDYQQSSDSADSPGDARRGRRRFLALCGSLAASGCAVPASPSGSKKSPRTGTPNPDDERTSGTGSAGSTASAGSNDRTWRLKRGDAANTGCTPGAVRIDEEFETAWRSGVGNITSPPVILDDVLFTGGGRTAYAIDIETGEKHWTVETDVITGNLSPAVAGDRVYVAGRGEEGGRLFAFATADGDTAWQYDLDVATSPMVADGRVFLGTAEGDRGVLHAVNAATGEQSWTFDVGDGHSRVGDVPAVVNGTVYCTAGQRLNAGEGAREGLFALDAATGYRQWTTTTTGPVVSAPAVSNGTVYVADLGGVVHAVDTATGDEEWTRQLDGSIRISPAVADGTVYVKDADGVCSALDANSGRRVWRAKADSSSIDLSIGGDTLYVGGNSLYAFDRTNGSRRWSYNVNAYSDSHYAPAITADSVFHGICIKEQAGEEYDNYVYSLV